MPSKTQKMTRDLAADILEAWLNKTPTPENTVFVKKSTAEVAEVYREFSAIIDRLRSGEST